MQVLVIIDANYVSSRQWYHGYHPFAKLLKSLTRSVVGLLGYNFE